MRAARRGRVVGVLCAVALVAADLAVVAPAGAAKPEPKQAIDLKALASEAPPERVLEVPSGDHSLVTPTPSDRNTVEVLGQFDAKQAPLPKPSAEGRGLVAQSSERVDELTTDRQLVFANPDGSHTALLSATPVRFQDASGVWKDVDLALIDGPDGKVATASGLPVTLLSDPTQGLSRWETPDGALVTRVVGIDGLTAAATTAMAGEVHYAGAKNVAVRASLTTTGVNQDVVLGDAAAPASYQFELVLPTGWTARQADSNGVDLLDGAGEVVGFFGGGLAHDASSGSPAEWAETPVTVTLAGVVEGVATVSVGIDPKWLADPARAFPVVIDPTTMVWISGGTQGFDTYTDYGAPTSSYGTSTSLAAGLVNGNIKYSYLLFTLAGGPTGGVNTSITDSHLTIYNTAGPGGFGQPMSVYGVGGGWSETTTWNNQPGTDAKGARSILDWYGTGPYGAAGWVNFDTTSLAESWIREGQPNLGLTMRATYGGTGSGRYFYSGNMAWYWPQLSITWFNGPNQSVPVAPIADAVLATPTPTLSVQAATDGPGVSYLYRVTTSPDAESGSIVWDSGAVSTTTSTIPAGRLVDGGVYYWHVWTWKGIDGYIVGNRPTWVRKFRVDLRLGTGTVSPSDGMGPVAVNLATGNATVTAGGPSFATVGGSIGATFTYNSKAPFTNGLLGRYFPNATLTGDAAMERIDQQVDVDWAAGNPGSPLPNDNFSARWTGYLTVPQSGNWRFSAINDYGVKVWVNNVLAVDRWSAPGGASYPGPDVNLTAGQPVPIKIEYRETTGVAYLRLRAQPPGGTGAAVPASWLTPDAPPLPTGWTFSADLDGGLSATGGARVGDTFVITNADGSTTTYSWTGTAWKPPPGDDSTLTSQSNGELTLQDTSGTLTTFNPDGTLKSVQSALDDVHPAAPTYTWTGNPARLTSITDPVSGRSVNFWYQGVASFDCPDPPSGLGFDANPPPGMLCGIEYWDDTGTALYYVSGQLARIANAVVETPQSGDPGPVVADFAYAGGKLTKVRDPLAADAVAAGVRDNDDTTRWLLAYGTDGRIESITAPKALASDSTRAQHSYAYNDGASPKTATVTYAGLTGTRTVAYNDYAQALTDTDPTGKTTTTTWNVTADRPERVKDPAGFTTTTIFDDAQRPTDSYGPAPDGWFGADNKPTSGYVSQTPRSQTFYDEGIVGLQVAYWNTTNLTGAAVAHDTGNLGTSGSIDKSWGSASPATGVNIDAWSARITGEITIPTAGTVEFRTYSDDGTRLYIDDKVVIDGWTNGAAIRGGEFANLVAGSKHRIRLEYYDASGAAEVHLYWNWQGQASVIVPGANLKARYGLVTKQIDPDAKTSTISYAAPHLGLATSTTTDPAGIALTEQTGYETYGASGSYLRRISRTLPAGNQWTYAYYGATETADNPCTTGTTESINQGGMLKTRTGPDPDNAVGGQTPRVEEFVYDKTGRAAASRVNGGSWTCPTFDIRGRVVATTIPPFDAQTSDRVVTTDYDVGSTPDPLTTSVTDDVGTITTTVDLLGRAISYTDVWGETTTTSYDQAGRATDSSGPLGAQHVDYDDAGRVTGIDLDGDTIAVPAYDSSGRFDSVAYPTGTGNAGNGTNLAPLTRDSLGRVTGITWRDPTNATLTSDAVTRSLAGRVVDQSIDGADAHSGDNFVYDGAGRLTTAYVPGHTLVYNYAATGGCGSLTTAGKNTNRTSRTDNGGTPITSCYDWADRLTSTTEPGLTGTITYDTHGNTTLLGGETFRYDGADRHVSSTANGTTVTYVRDATDRIVERTQTGPGPITWRATSTPTQTDGTSTTVNVARPTGTENGDVLIAHLAVGTNTTITPPSGWTQIRTIAEGSAVRGGTYWHLAAGADPSSWDWTLASAQPAVGSITAYAGVNTTTPIEDSSTKNETSSTTPTARSVTTTSYGAVLITAYALTTATTVTPPAGLTERVDASSTGTAPVTSEYADTILGAAGATGDRDATVASAVASANITIALKPATITETQRYGYTGGGDTPDLTFNTSNQVVERVIGLPGGASITTRATGDVWSYPNIHGDAVLTANASGVQTGGTFQYDPYGNELNGLPDNSAGDYDNGWLGQHQRGFEHAPGLRGIVEMGARQYSSTLGRFLELDPAQGGSDNDYDYVAGDPINSFDVEGTWLGCRGEGWKGKKLKRCRKKAHRLHKKGIYGSKKKTRERYESRMEDGFICDFGCDLARAAGDVLEVGGYVMQGAGYALAIPTGGTSLWLVGAGNVVTAAGQLANGDECGAAFTVGLTVLGGGLTYSLSQAGLKGTAMGLDAYANVAGAVAKPRC